MPSRRAARGLTLVDLSDGWAPAIFQDGLAADGRPLPNRYRPIFVGLASDRTDGDGQPLRPGEKNFLELYGIPPSLSVLHARFLADGDRPCLARVDAAQACWRSTRSPAGAPSTEKKEQQRARAEPSGWNAGLLGGAARPPDAGDPGAAGRAADPSWRKRT